MIEHSLPLNWIISLRVGKLLWVTYPNNFNANVVNFQPEYQLFKQVHTVYKGKYHR